MFARLADLAYRRPRRVLIAAFAVVAVCGVFGGPVAAKLSTANSNFEDSGSESVKARNLIERHSGADPDIAMVVLVRLQGDARSSAARSEVQGLAATIERDPSVARVVDFYNTHGTTFVSRDGRSTYLAVAFKPESSSADESAAKRLNKVLSKQPGVKVGGAVLAGTQVGTQVGKDLGRAEALAFPILFVLLFLIFRGVVSAFLPLI